MNELTAAFPLVARVRQILEDDKRLRETPVFLVGGALRDFFLHTPSHDLDFSLPGQAIPAARRVADALQAGFFVLDTERETARVVLESPSGQHTFLDFARFRAATLEDDLRDRDLTINAMAVDIRQPDHLIDPLDGLQDLREKRLRACSPTAFLDDPLRILRTVRLATKLRFHITPETRKAMREATGRLTHVSAERLRDELFHILEGPRPAAAIRALDLLGVLPYLLPELPAMHGVTQSTPHIHDVWNHTLATLDRLDQVLHVLGLEHDEEATAELHSGLISLWLGRYRTQIAKHMAAALHPYRSHRALLRFAALYHDVAKPQTRSIDPDGRIRFFHHDSVGAQTIAERAQALRLSNPEVERLRVIVQHHLRPHHLAKTPPPPSRRAIYRFFRDTGAAGVDICLLSLADELAIAEHTLDQDTWDRYVQTIRALLEAWWEHPEEQVAPPSLVSGRDLIHLLGAEPGPGLGALLEAIREAQAVGLIHTREQAIEFARRQLEEAKQQPGSI